MSRHFCWGNLIAIRHMDQSYMWLCAGLKMLWPAADAVQLTPLKPLPACLQSENLPCDLEKTGTEVLIPCTRICLHPWIRVGTLLCRKLSICAKLCRTDMPSPVQILDGACFPAKCLSWAPNGPVLPHSRVWASPTARSACKEISCSGSKNMSFREYFSHLLRISTHVTFQLLS